MKVVQNTRPLGARVKASEIDGLVRALTIQEQAHGSDRPRQNDRSSGIDTPRFEVGPRALQRAKGGRGLRRTKGVEFLFPRGVGNLVVNHDVPVRTQLMAPPDHDLAVDEPFVDPEEYDRHGVTQRPESGATIEDERLDVKADLDYYLDNGKDTFAAGFSKENDYLSVHGGLGAQRHFNDKNTTLDFAGSFAYDWIEPTGGGTA